MDNEFIFCRGKESRNGIMFVCPHIEFCVRYSKRKSASEFRKVFKKLPVDNRSSCRQFVLKKELAVEARIGTIKKGRAPRAKGKHE